jgi:hypothetical protein
MAPAIALSASAAPAASTTATPPGLEGASAKAIAPALATATPAGSAAGAGAGPGSPASPAESAKAAPHAAQARLLLLGDGTQVSVDGVAVGRCPQRVTVDPGAHTVLFTFPATGESRSEALTLRAGEHTTLRADFTGATPTLRVQP